MNYDVIVAGFGTAGAMAAIAAARQGATVLVLERTSYPGGLQTGGFITGYYVQEPVGLAAELEAKAQALMASTDAYACGIEPKKLVIEREAVAVGVDIRYEVLITDVQVESGQIVSLGWLENGESFRASAGVVIDATAEAEVASMAGCECISGRRSDGRYQHSSNIFHCLKGKGEHKRYGYLGQNLRVRQDQVSEFSVSTLHTSAAMIGANGESTRLTAPSDLPGIREGRHVVPSRKLWSLYDFLLAQEEISEPVAFAYSHFDTNISDFALESESFQDWMTVAAMWGTRLWLAIPRDALNSRNVGRLLVAGRHWGVDHDVGHALRMNSAMGCIGEAAGVIAACAARLGMTPEAVPYAMIREKLALPTSPLPQNECLWGLPDDEIKAGLESDCPGKAIWSAYRSQRYEVLKTCFEQAADETKTKARAAFALALLHEEYVIPFLRQLAGERDSTAMCSSVHDAGMGAATITTRHGYIAVYLLGRFRDTGSVDLLGNILADNECPYRFEYQSLAIVALLKIAEAHPECRVKIARVLRSLAEDPGWTLEMRFIKYARPEVRVDDVFRSLITDQLSSWGV